MPRPKNDLSGDSLRNILVKEEVPDKPGWYVCICPTCRTVTQRSTQAIAENRWTCRICPTLKDYRLWSNMHDHYVHIRRCRDPLGVPDGWYRVCDSRRDQFWQYGDMTQAHPVDYPLYVHKEKAYRHHEPLPDGTLPPPPPTN